MAQGTACEGGDGAAERPSERGELVGRAVCAAAARPEARLEGLGHGRASSSVCKRCKRNEKAAVRASPPTNWGGLPRCPAGPTLEGPSGAAATPRQPCLPSGTSCMSQEAVLNAASAASALTDWPALRVGDRRPVDKFSRFHQRHKAGRRRTTSDKPGGHKVSVQTMKDRVQRFAAIYRLRQRRRETAAPGGELGWRRRANLGNLLHAAGPQRVCLPGPGHLAAQQPSIRWARCPLFDWTAGNTEHGTE